jgi:Bcr/CflA subfamily drug resistance transporter
MKQYSIAQIIFILTPFVFSFAFGLDIYIPVIPQMTKIFDTTPALIHLTLSLFLGITGLGQLFIGPLADRFGRQWTFYSSSLLYGSGALLCAAASEISTLIAGRAVCALGACGLLVTSFAVVRDLYSKEQSAKIYSYINGAVGISPTFAPIIGGYLSFYLGWQSIFFFLSLIGLLTILMTMRFISETLPTEKRISFDREVFSRYLQIVCNRQFLIFTAISGLAEGVFFCFFSISPFIIIDLLEVATQNFGYYFAAFGLVIALGGFASGKLIEARGVHFTIAVGIAIMLVGGVVMVAWACSAGLSLLGFLFPMVLACSGAMFTIGACASAALEPFAKIAGTAAAAFGACQFSLSAAMGAALMLFPVASTVPYGIIIIAAALLAYLLYQQRPDSHAEAIQPYIG